MPAANGKPSEKVPGLLGNAVAPVSECRYANCSFVLLTEKRGD